MDDDLIRAVHDLLATHLEGVEALREHVEQKEYFDQYFVGVLKAWHGKLDSESSDVLTERDLERGLPTIVLLTRQIVKTVPAAAAIAKPFHADLRVVARLFAARSLPNEAALRRALNSLLDEYVTQGPRQAEHYVADGEHVEMTADTWLPALEEFSSAYVLSTKSGCLVVESEEPELLERLHKEASSALRKAYGKPAGTRAHRRFSHDDGEVRVGLATLRRQAEFMGPIYSLSLCGARELLGRSKLHF